jgi:hypothetical protein
MFFYLYISQNLSISHWKIQICKRVANFSNLSVENHPKSERSNFTVFNGILICSLSKRALVLSCFGYHGEGRLEDWGH